MIPPIVPNVQVKNLDSYTRDRQVTWDLIPDLNIISAITGYSGPAGATGISGYNVYRSEVSYDDYTVLNSVLLPPAATYFNDSPPITPVTPFQWWYKVTAVNYLGEEGVIGGYTAGYTGAFPALDQDITVFNNSPFPTMDPKALTEQNQTFPKDGRALQILSKTAVNPRWFLEIRRRHIWLLEMGGKPVWLLKRRYSGPHELPDPNIPFTDLPPGTSFDPLRWQHKQGATETTQDNTYGVGYLQGYHTPFKILVSFINPATRSSKIQMYGVEADFEPSSWTMWEPNLLDHDILVRADNNERYEVLNVKRSNWRGLILHQRFDTKLIEPSNIAYKIPVPTI